MRYGKVIYLVPLGAPGRRELTGVEVEEKLSVSRGSTSTKRDQ